VEAPRNESSEPLTPDPGSSANPESRTPDPVSFPKPRRKYTTSEKSRAASRKNLEKANQAPHWLKYRVTERRLIACYRALEKAVAELRRFDSPHYGLGFKRGTHCASLLRSLALAGETREEYEAHLERMRKAFAPLSERDRKLVLAAAQAVWRRLRVYGGQGRWELYALASLLAELIAERKAEAERRAAAERAGEKAEPLDPYLDPLGSERAMMLGIQLIGLLQEDGVEKEAGRLNRRIELLLEALGQEPQEPQEPGGEGEATEPGEPKEPRETDETEQTDNETFAAVNGNPLRPPADLAATLNQERAPLKHPAQWQNVQALQEDAARGPEGKKKSDPHPCENAADLAQRGGLMRSLLRQGRQGQLGMNNPLFSRLEGPEGKAVWIDLWQRAFGPAGEERNAKLQHHQAGFAFPVSTNEILEVAETTWERIQMHLQHREKEAAKVKEVLESCIKRIADCRSTIDDCPADETRNSKFENRNSEPENGGASFDFRVSNFESRVSSAELAAALIAALGVYKCMGAVLEAGKDIKAAYYRMLVALYGDLPSFEFFKPKAPTLHDRVNDLGDFVLNLFAAKGGPLDQEKQQQIKWRGRSGPQPLGGP